MSAKYWRRSRTLIFNALVVMVTTLLAMTDELQVVMSPRAYALSMIGLAVTNAVLRLVTRQPLTRKKEL